MSSPERRRSPRRPVLDTFSLYVVVPSKGPGRLRVKDVSDQGIGFDFDLEFEDPRTFSVSPGDSMEILFYLNQSLALPLSIEVARIAQQDPDAPRLVGAELRDIQSPAHQAFLAFVKLLDKLKDVAVVQGRI